MKTHSEVTIEPTRFLSAHTKTSELKNNWLDIMIN